MSGEEQWQAFWGRHEGLWALIDATDEGFWADLTDVVTVTRAQQYTTRGAVVSELPPGEEVGIQTEPPRNFREVGTQTEPGELEASERSPGRDGPEEERRSGVLPAIPRGCWNCREEGHRYSNCPRLMTRFCFGCGQRGTTLRSCPRCGPHYHLLGPYSGWRGPRTGPAPQPRVLPWARTPEPLEDESDEEEWGWRKPGAATTGSPYPS